MRADDTTSPPHSFRTLRSFGKAALERLTVVTGLTRGGLESTDTPLIGAGVTGLAAAGEDARA
jgi:hypothetical protein